MRGRMLGGSSHKCVFYSRCKGKTFKVVRGRLNLCFIKIILSVLWKLDLVEKESREILHIEDDSN